MMSRGSEIGVAVVGLGFMGRTHIAAFQGFDRCRVVAAVDPAIGDPGRATGSIGNLDGGGSGFDPTSIRMHAGLEAVLADPEVDLVSIATPTPTHASLAHAVIDAGRHLLIEKPVDLDPEAIREIGRHAGKAGIVAMPAHCMRFWPAWRWMKRTIDEGIHGKCLQASFLRSGAAPDWNPDFYLDESRSGGAIVDLHMHDTDFVIHCFGTPEAVVSDGSRRYVRTRYEYVDGPQVVAEGGWLDDPEATFTMRASLEFEHATVTFDLGRDPDVVLVGTDGVEAVPAIESGTGYDGEVRAVVAAIDDPASPPPVTLEDAAETARIVGIEIESAARGGARLACGGRASESEHPSD